MFYCLDINVNYLWYEFAKTFTATRQASADSVHSVTLDRFRKLHLMPRRDEERIGRGLPSDEERIGRGLPSAILLFTESVEVYRVIYCVSVIVYIGFGLDNEVSIRKMPKKHKTSAKKSEESIAEEDKKDESLALEIESSPTEDQTEVTIDPPKEPSPEPIYDEPVLSELIIEMCVFILHQFSRLFNTSNFQ